MYSGVGRGSWRVGGGGLGSAPRPSLRSGRSAAPSPPLPSMGSPRICSRTSSLKDEGEMGFTSLFKTPFRGPNNGVHLKE
jgi:hypothetical protein